MAGMKLKEVKFQMSLVDVTHRIDFIMVSQFSLLEPDQAKWIVLLTNICSDRVKYTGAIMSSLVQWGIGAIKGEGSEKGRDLGRTQRWKNARAIEQIVFQENLLSQESREK